VILVESPKADINLSEKSCFYSPSELFSWKDSVNITATTKKLMAKLTSEVNLRATRDLGKDSGKSITKQKKDAQTISPISLPVVSYCPSHHGTISLSKFSNVNGIRVLNRAI
jgi:hypothetical protein